MAFCFTLHVCPKCETIPAAAATPIFWHGICTMTTSNDSNQARMSNRTLANTLVSERPRWHAYPLHGWHRLHATLQCNNATAAVVLSCTVPTHMLRSHT